MVLHLRYRIAAALACILMCAAPAGAQVLLPLGFVNDTLFTGLSEPTSMAFLPDGRLLITEQRSGKLKLFVNGHIAAGDPVIVVPDLLSNTYERGFQGVAVDPDWPLRPYVYLYYNRVGGFCRLVRYTASGDLSDSAGRAWHSAIRCSCSTTFPTNTAITTPVACASAPGITCS